MISVKNLSFGYSKDTSVFDDLKFNLDGYFNGLIGINGAGKSTFLKLCLGLRTPRSGDITIKGFSVSSNNIDLLRHIGILHENPKFPSWARVHSYLQWVGEVRGLNKKKSAAQANYLLKKFGILDKKYERVVNLSAGQTQKFGISQAIIGIPDIIFLDEPTANLDVQSRSMVLEMLKDLVDRYNVRIVIMSHILSDLERYCDTVAILHKGEIRYQGLINDLIRDEFNREYIIRGPDLNIIENDLKNKGFNISRSAEYELILKLDNIDELNSVRNNLTRGTSLTSYRSLLEQKFLEVTGV